MAKDSLLVDTRETSISTIDSYILGTELNLNETSENAISTDVLIVFGINMIENAAKLWRVADEVEKQRLQVAIFPEGLSYDFVFGFETVKMSNLYKLINQLGPHVR